MSAPRLPAAALRRIDRLLAGPAPRIVLGIAGAPGAGKSTLAEALCAHLGACSQVLPMDGFHLAQVELQRLGRADRKGAPDTFDVAGYAALLARVRAQRPGDAVIYASAFDRGLEEPIAGAIPIAADVRLVITEGNYLLLEDGEWRGVRSQLDEAWFLAGDDALRRERLLQRHLRHGRSPEAARAWVDSTDEPNARRIAATRHRADWVLRWPEE